MLMESSCSCWIGANLGKGQLGVPDLLTTQLFPGNVANSDSDGRECKMRGIEVIAAIDGLLISHVNAGNCVLGLPGRSAVLSLRFRADAFNVLSQKKISLGKVCFASTDLSEKLISKVRELDGQWWINDELNATGENKGDEAK